MPFTQVGEFILAKSMFLKQKLRVARVERVERVERLEGLKG